MKKTLFLLAAAAISTACSMDETTEVAGNGLPIDFRTAVATRSSTFTTAGLNQFDVSAFYSNDGKELFTKETAQKEEDGSTFTTTTEYYWPTDGSELTFYAYAPVGLSNVDLTSLGSSTINYTPNIDDQEDIITAAATGTRILNEEKGVELTFRHALSKINVEAKSTATKYTIKVIGVKIANVNTSGTYTFNAENENYGEWTSNTPNNYFVEYEDSPKELTGEAVSIMKSDDASWMLIPQILEAWDQTSSDEGTYLAVKIRITNKAEEVIYPITDGEDQYDWAAVPINTEWKPNTNYTYTLTFSDSSAGLIPPGEPEGGKPILGKPIKFIVTEVEEWTPSTENITLGGE